MRLAQINTKVACTASGKRFCIASATSIVLKAVKEVDIRRHLGAVLGIGNYSLSNKLWGSKTSSTRTRTHTVVFELHFFRSPHPTLYAERVITYMRVTLTPLPHPTLYAQGVITQMWVTLTSPSPPHPICTRCDNPPAVEIPTCFLRVCWPTCDEVRDTPPIICICRHFRCGLD